MTYCHCGNPLGGELVILNGFVAIRLHCMLGCPQPNGGWFKDRIDATPVIDPHKVSVVQCIDCGADVRTRHRGTKRCDHCRHEKQLNLGRLAWKRYQQNLKVPA